MSDRALVKNGIVQNLIVVNESTDQEYLDQIEEEYDEVINVDGRLDRPGPGMHLEDGKFYPPPGFNIRAGMPRPGIATEFEVEYIGPPSKAPQNGTTVPVVFAENSAEQEVEVKFAQGRARGRFTPHEAGTVTVAIDGAEHPAQLEVVALEPPNAAPAEATEEVL